MDVFPEARTCFSQVVIPPGFSQLTGERAKECLLRCVLEEAAASSSAASDFEEAQRALQVSESYNNCHDKRLAFLSVDRFVRFALLLPSIHQSLNQSIHPSFHPSMNESRPRWPRRRKPFTRRKRTTGLCPKRCGSSSRTRTSAAAAASAPSCTKPAPTSVRTTASRSAPARSPTPAQSAAGSPRSYRTGPDGTATLRGKARLPGNHSCTAGHSLRGQWDSS